ncbi:MAG: hypothetical protein HQK49_07620 [Oligoflexia bacterium]|nr:hypothetical protein [Oligoflexia bacterium]
MKKKIGVFHKNIEKQNEDQNTIIMTTTNELYMAVRLYYHIYNLDELLLRLKELSCINWNTENRSFFINYNEEAKNIGLTVKYDAVPKDLFPVILAEGNIENKNDLYLDLRSFERAVCLVKFIDQHIDRSILKVTHAATYNKIQSADKNNFKKVWDLDYDELFSGNNMKIIDPDEEFRRLESLTANIHDHANKLAVFDNEYKNKEMPLIEKFPVNYYEDGIQSFN